MVAIDVERSAVVHAARRDPNLGVWFLTGKRPAHLHGQFQRHLSEHEDSYSELHRGIGKTTQVTARVAWEIGRRPSVRVKYVQQTDPEAAKSVRVIRSLIRSKRFRLLFPHVRLAKDDRSAHSLSVVDARREEEVDFDRDSTVEAVGIFGRAGGRADILIADDVCDMRNAILRPAEREQAKDAWKTNWLPMRDFTEGRRPRTWKVGTPYHVDDITAEWRAMHGRDGTLLRRPVVGFASPWPEAFSPELMRDLREELGPIAYGRAYELVPVSSDMLVFQPEWLEKGYYVGDVPDAHCVGQFIGAVDFAFSDRKTVKKQDPDWSVFLVAWQSSLGHLWLREIVRLRATFPEFRRRVNATAARLGVTRIYAEANGPQAGLVQEMREGSMCPIVGVERVVDKVVRAAEQQPFVEQGRLHIPAMQDVGHTLRPRQDFAVMIEEMLCFPAASHDDTVDPAIDLMAHSAGSREDSAPAIVRHESADPFSRIYGAAG